MIHLKGKYLGTSGSATKSLGANNNIQKTKSEHQKHQPQSDFVSTSFTSTSAGDVPGPNISNLPITVDLEPMLYGIAENSLASRTTFTRLYRDMYYYDAICGTTVDLYSSLPFSEFTLGGIKDPKILDLYYENIERLNIRTLLNELSIDYLVTGTFLGSLLYNRDKKLFFDIMPHDIGNADIIPMPFYSQDPIITMKFPIEVAKALNSSSARVAKIKEKLGHSVIDKLLGGSIELDPIGTIYLPRKTFAHSEGTSFFKRVLPIYLIEKNLFRGTLMESAKRQRGILHITVGDGDQWEPSQGDMESITDLFMCLSGDSMLHTDQGLKRLDSICDRKGMAKDTHQKIDLNLKGADGKMCKATKWWYRGYAPIVKVSTEYGYHIKGTEDHRVYVLSEEGPHWKKIKNLKFTDYLCIDKKQVEQKSNPKLDWGNVEINCHDTNSKVVTLPSRMTLELAYLLGLAIAEGDFSQDCIRLGNTDLDILKKYVECFKTLGLPADYAKSNRQLAGTVAKFGEIESIRKRDYYNVIGTNSRVLMRYFANLGIECNGSFTQEIPQVILDSSVECQASFLAGIVDGDGSLVDSQYRVYSRSKKLLHQLQVLMLNFGIISCVNQDYPFINLSAHHSQILASHINEHLACKYKKLKVKDHSCKKSGVPSHWLHTTLKERHIERKDGGEWFYDDDDQPIFIKGFGQITSRCFGAVVGKGNLRKGRLIKDTYESGKYDEAFEALRKISASAHNKLISLFEADYNFFKVESFSNCGKKHVYDLTISNDSKPAFVVNGILVHNSADADPLGAIITTRLGISTEEIRCVAGDTLICTDDGLVRIDELTNYEIDEHCSPFTVPTELCVKGVDGSFIEIDEWHYQGFKPTFEYMTESGSSITCTQNHKFSVLTANGDLVLRKANTITDTDYVCLSLGGDTIESKLPLNLIIPEVESIPSNANLTIPKYMTVELAWIIGFVLSDGYIRKSGVSVTSNNIDLLHTFAKYIKNVFNLDASIKLKQEEGIRRIKGKEHYCQNHYYSGINSKHVVDILLQLGLQQASHLNAAIPNNHVPCTYYEIPWSILKADRVSKLAFLAAFVDGDGSIIKDKDSIIDSVQIRFFSFSHKILNVIKIMLADLGYHSRLSLNEEIVSRLDIVNSVSAKLYNELKPYITSESKKPFDFCDTLKIKEYGIPADAFVPLLKSRVIRRSSKGTWFYDDDQNPVEVKGGWSTVFRQYVHVGSYFLYEGLDKGTYDAELNIISQVSPKLYRKIQFLHSMRYKFERLVRVVDKGRQHVYDLSVKGNEEGKAPIIVTNGIVTHQSGGDFWKYTDISDQTGAMKLKALGISDSFLGGDATLNCVIGPTMIPTSNGLQRIGGICNENKGKVQNVYFEVGSRYGSERATKWVYSGEHPTICVTAESGNSITGTHKHKLLVLRDDVLDWVLLKDIKLTDYLCINPNSAVRRHDYVAFNNTVTIDYRLAYIIGCILKKGYSEKGNIKLVLNSETASQFVDYFCQLFYKIESVENRAKFQVTITDSKSVELLNKLVGNKNSLPWPICKTSAEAQLSFVAALVDCSSLYKLTFDSPTFGKELQCLLNYLGIMCDLKYNYILFPEGEDYVIWDLILDYCATTYAVHYKPRNWYGMPQSDGSVLAYHDMDSISEALEHKYRFIKVVSIKDAGIQKVYDLSINPSNPSYIANGFVSHNTTEASLSVFIEQLRAYRDRITRKLLYNKVFPLISMVNGLSVKNGRVIRSNNVLDVDNALDLLQDGSKLVIPIVHWNKQLKPEGDTAYLDLLDRMTAAGVPVPLRAMAAAGGFNLDELLAQQDDDLNIRERMKTYTDKLAKFKAAAEGGGDGESESGSFMSESAMLNLLDADPSERYSSAVLGSGSRKSPLKREFDPEIVGQTRTGKKKLILDQVAANKKANSNIIKAVKNVSKHKKTPLTHKTTTVPKAGD